MFLIQQPNTLIIILIERRISIRLYSYLQFTDNTMDHGYGERHDYFITAAYFHIRLIITVTRNMSLLLQPNEKKQCVFVI
jgi:hypothetical protein